MDCAKILITGVAGFIGSFLAQRMLDEGYYVVGIDNFFRGKRENIKCFEKHPKFEFYKISILDKRIPKKIFHDVEVVFHYAAINGTKFFYEIPLKILNINLLGTLNILKYSINSQTIDKFIFASSSEVYGDPIKLPISEDHPILISSVNNPRNSYAISKAMGEFYVKWMCEESDIKYLIFRIFNTYGPRMDTSEYGQVIPEFIRKALLSEKFTIIGPGTQTRSFCYIDDNIEFTVRAFKDINNTILNLGSNEEIQIIELAKLIHELIGREFKYTLLPPRLGDPKRRVPDISKIISLTNYKPKISLREGLIRTISWYKEKWRLK